MATLPKDVESEIKTLAYELCEKYRYGTGDIDSSGFINLLLSREDVGGRLKQYLPESRVRVYIKDTLCGRYTKDLIAAKMEKYSATEAVKQVYGVGTIIVGKSGYVTICREEQGELIYLVDYSTLIRWESALRRIMEYIAKTPSIYENSSNVRICLVVVDQTEKMSYSDKQFLEKTLGLVKAKALIV